MRPRTEKYLALLSALLGSPGHGPSGPTPATFRAGLRWSSPTSSLPPSSRFAFHSLLGEQCMALYLYAALLQEQAYDLGSRLLAAPPPPSPASAAAGAGAREGAGRAGSPGCGGSPGKGKPGGSPGSERRRWSYTPVPASASPAPADSAEACAAVAALYRRAAGVYQFLEDELVPKLAAEPPELLPADRPLELWPGAAGAMAALALAQAQVGQGRAGGGGVGGWGSGGRGARQQGAGGGVHNVARAWPA